MKTKLLILLFSCLFTGTICQAQFPAPHSFMISMGYIEWGNMGYCCGQFVSGPTHCGYNLDWVSPDLSETEAQLMGYNIYSYTGDYHEGMEIPFSDAEIIAYTTNTYLNIDGCGIDIGDIVWITAVYSDPEGESKPSNIVDKDNILLATAIKKVEREPFSLAYNNQKNGIEIKGMENIAFFSIFRLDGIGISIPAISDFIDTKDMGKGVYIIKITTKDGGIISDKIIIE